MNNKAYHIKNFSSKKLIKYVDGYKVYYFNDNIPIKLNPTGHFELIFQLTGSFSQNTSTTRGWELRPKNFVGGLHSRSFSVKAKDKNAKLISVLLKPDCSKYFVPDRLNLFKNKIISLDELFGQSKLDSLNSECENELEFLKRIEEFLISILTEKKSSAIDYSLRKIFQQNGFIKINQLAKSIHISQSQFRKRFNEEIGMSPKEYSKIVRFNFISNFLSQNPKVNLTNLTYELGYFDQSHFVKDFQSIAGLSPKKYMQQINPR